MNITITQGPFLPVPPILGGAVEKAWFALGQEFARRGHTVTHISRAHRELPRTQVINGVQHLRISGFTATPSPLRRNLYDLWYGLRVLRHLPPADILVTNSFWLPWLSRNRAHGIPYVHVARYPKGQLRLYHRAILQTVSAPIRDAIVAEDPTAAERTRVIPYPISPTYNLKPHLLQPQTVPPESNPPFASFSSSISDGGSSASPFGLQSGTSVSPFGAQSSSGPRTLLYAGRIHPEKGLLHLIQAFARLPAALRAEWKLKIVGPWETAQGGGGQAHLNELHHAAARISDRVEFTGPVFAETRLIAHYRAAQVFVYPSLAERGETFGLAALEAMASGCAPVVSSLACFQDFIKHNVNGLIYDHRAPDPAEALAQTLTGLLPDPTRITRLRTAAHQTAQHYTLDQIATQFLEDFAALRAAKVAGSE